MTEKFRNILNNVNIEILENPGVNLVEEGVIDSLDVMNLVASIEKEFGIEFDPDDILPETFASVEAIWAIIEKYIKEQA